MSVRSAAVERAAPTVEVTVAQMVERQRHAIERALPMNLNADRFARIVVTECKANPGLMKCDAGSLMAAVMRAAQLGLEPGPLGHCYLVPFGGQVQFMMGYKGLLDLARRSGQIEDIYAYCVYEGDQFAYQLGLNRNVHHVPAVAAERDPQKITHAYAVARFKDGGLAFEVLTRADIDARRKRSRSSGTGPWVTDYPAMARKTAVRALAPYLPLTADVARDIVRDEGTAVAIAGETVDISYAAEIDTPAIEAETGIVEAEVVGVDG